MQKLRQWLYDNIYLADYPFDKLIELMEEVLLDETVTQKKPPTSLRL